MGWECVYEVHIVIGHDGTQQREQSQGLNKTLNPISNITRY